MGERSLTASAIIRIFFWISGSDFYMCLDRILQTKKIKKILDTLSSPNNSMHVAL